MISIALKAFVSWLLSRLFGGGDKARDDEIALGRAQAKSEQLESDNEELKSQTQALADRPNNDDDFASRVRSFEAHNGKPDTP
jgi:hypothetical protein